MSIVTKQLVKAANGKFVPIAVLYPDGYTTGKILPTIIQLGGVGERTQNTPNPNNEDWRGWLDILINSSPANLYKNHGAQGFIVIVPLLTQSEGDWPTWYMETTWSFAQMLPGVNLKSIHFTGLSLGGGGEVAYLSTFAVKKFTTITILCPYIWTINATALAAQRTPILFYHSMDDGVSFRNSENAYNAIMAANPTVKPTYLLTNGFGHNVWDNNFDPNSKIWDGKSWWDMAKAASHDNPVQIPATGAVQVPKSPTTLNMKAVLKATIQGNDIYLDGTGSEGVQSWEMHKITGPGSDSGGNWGLGTPNTHTGPNGSVPIKLYKNAADGTYKFRLTMFGAGAPVTADVDIIKGAGGPVVQPPVPAPETVVSTQLMTMKTYSTGRIELIPA